MRKSHLKPLAAVTGALALAATLSACGGSSAASDEKIVTVYSADGLKGENGDGWYDKVFKDFEKKTGIKVEYVEGGSGEMVQRALREKSNTQADVLVTLPPFIQQADTKGLLTAYEPAGSDQVDGADKASDSKWTSVVNNYFGFVYNKKELKTAPTTWDELTDGKYKEKIQYSTPGVAGDGTAVLIKAMHDFGGKEAGDGVPEEAPGQQRRAVRLHRQARPQGRQGRTARRQRRRPDELRAVQGHAEPRHLVPGEGLPEPTTFALPYAAGLVNKAPHSANGKKLLDFMLSEQAQKDVSEVGGGFSARKDVEATDANAIALSKLMNGVEVFEPDWSEIGANLDGYVDAWKTATGS